MQKSRRKCHVRPIIGAASLVLFADVCVKIFNHSYGYAEKFMPCPPQKLLRLIRHNKLDMALARITKN